MSATEPRYCPVSTLLSTSAALPSIRRRHGGRPGYSVVSEAAGDHRRDQSCAPGRRCSPRHLRRPSRRSAANWLKGVIRRRQPSVVGRVVVAVTVVAVRRPRQRSVVVGPARQEAPDHAREAGDQGRSEENASQRRTRGYGNNVGDGKEDYRYAASHQRKYRTAGQPHGEGLATMSETHPGLISILRALDRGLLVLVGSLKRVAPQLQLPPLRFPAEL